MESAPCNLNDIRTHVLVINMARDLQKCCRVHIFTGESEGKYKIFRFDKRKSNSSWKECNSERHKNAHVQIGSVTELVAFIPLPEF